MDTIDEHRMRLIRLVEEKDAEIARLSSALAAAEARIRVLEDVRDTVGKFSLRITELENQLASRDAQIAVLSEAQDMTSSDRQGGEWRPIETAPKTKGHVLATDAEDYPYMIELLVTPFFMHNGELHAMNQNSGNLNKVKQYTDWMPVPDPPTLPDKQETKE